ncbi:MAG: copper oxidase [Meiothermus sp.]
MGPVMHRLLLVLTLLGLFTASASRPNPALDGKLCTLPLSLAQTETSTSGQVRVYYIGAVKLRWDYAPSGRNLISNIALNQDPEAAVFTAPGPERIGRTYWKARYVEFTDATFTKTKAEADPEYRVRWKHLGMLGPIIHAEVGDEVHIVFKNLTPKADNLALSVHMHGLEYDKDAEGAPYGGRDNPGDRVLPGQTYTYLYKVPESAGPGPMDPSSVVWMYHSHVDEVADTYAGLIGAAVVSAKGKAKPDGSPADVDREFFTLYHVFNENLSPYLPQNLKPLRKKPAEGDEAFEESNLMHSINGYVYGNLPGLEMAVGERVRWYALGMGTEVDLHTPHWHGQTVLYNGMRMDMLELLPGSMKVADMVPRTAGTWLLHCHVNDHIKAGMSALFVVKPEAPGTGQ